jgi:long-chain acyl-CoA synthetase
MGDPKTINELFAGAADRYRNVEFLRYKLDGRWISIAYDDLARKVKHVALGLHALGFTSGDRMAIWSANRPEWNVADLAVLAIGAADVPIYTTQARSQVEYILSDSNARAMFVSSALLPVALEIKSRVPSLEILICFDEVMADPRDKSVIHLKKVADKGRALNAKEPRLYEELRDAVAPDDLASQIYTSGSTGEPKGVMLTHKNLASNVLFTYRWLGIERERDLALSYLPLSHIFERAVWYLFMYSGTVVAYAESIDTVGQNLAEVRPTVMTSVPRMFEKIYARIMEQGIAAGFPRRQILLWSLGIAREWARLRDRNRKIGWLLALKHKVTDLLVYKKIRQTVGGRIRLFISGGAPLAPEIAYVFSGAGLTILQGYGLTETSPSVSCNTEKRNRIGTVGPIIDGVSVRIAPDGEILVRGDNVTSGYFNAPLENSEAFTQDGWFRTGDIGFIDDDGFLTITDRKKDLIKTSGGKYIAPQKLESLIKSSRFVSQVVVVGNGRKFASALVVPNMDMIRSYGEVKGLKYPSMSKLLTDPKVIDLMERQIEKYTGDLAGYEKVKRIALLENELTVDSEELTPTLKPRRSFIEKKYAAVIDSLYGESARRPEPIASGQ